MVEGIVCHYSPLSVCPVVLVIWNLRDEKVMRYCFVVGRSKSSNCFEYYWRLRRGYRKASIEYHQPLVDHLAHDGTLEPFIANELALCGLRILRMCN